MGKQVDLVGKKFGKLTVIYKTRKQRKHGTKGTKVAWFCECDCGGTNIVLTGELKGGYITSCGCKLSEAAARNNKRRTGTLAGPNKGCDLSGQVFGRLTVVCPTDKRGGGGLIYYYCKCSCGGDNLVSYSNLKSGGVSSCGCLGRETLKALAEERKISLKGEKSPLYNPNLTAEDRARHSNRDVVDPQNKVWRREVFDHDKGTCQCCGASGQGVKLNAHHLEDYFTNPDMRYNIDNGITLCATVSKGKGKDRVVFHKGCHQEFHSMFGKGNNTTSQFLEFIHTPIEEAA